MSSEIRAERAEMWARNLLDGLRRGWGAGNGPGIRDDRQHAQDQLQAQESERRHPAGSSPGKRALGWSERAQVHVVRL
jgi:hypothetical protein